MSSILTNMSAMSALQNLNATQKNLNQIQGQISTGLKIASASDNAAYWSISTSMKADTNALGAVTSALNLGASVLGTATSAMSSVNTILKQMQSDIVTAQTAGTNKGQVQTDVSAQQQSLLSIMGSASFNGVNLLDGSTSTTSIVSSFTQTASGSTITGTLSVNTSGIALGGSGAAGGLLGTAVSGVSSSSAGSTASATAASGAFDSKSILGFNLTSATASDLAALSTAIATAITNTTTASASLGQYTTTVNNQLTFTTALSDAITSGVGSLVDADMNEASTRLNALQTQQQLGVQALSIANQNSQLILKLFQ